MLADGGKQLANLLGDVSGMVRKFDLETYFNEAAAWNVKKIVHVSAAASPVDETKELEEQARASDQPAAIIGAVGQSDAVSETLGQLEQQLGASRFRGVRAPAFEAGVPPREILEL